MRKVMKQGAFLISILIIVGLAGCQSSSNKSAGFNRQSQTDPALRLRQNLCLSGVAEACLELANIYLKEERTPATEMKIEWALINACNSGSGLGCYQSAEFFENNIGKRAAFDAASGWYIAAQNYYDVECKAGNNLSCFNSGVMSYNGDKVSKDLKSAIASYEIACNRSMAKACTNLASIYMDDKEAFTDTERGVALLRKACDGDDKLACTQLGILYAAGVAVEQDLATAYNYFDKSCRLDPATKLCQKTLKEKEACRSTPEAEFCQKILREKTS